MLVTGHALDRAAAIAGLDVYRGQLGEEDHARFAEYERAYNAQVAARRVGHDPVTLDQLHEQERKLLAEINFASDFDDRREQLLVEFEYALAVAKNTRADVDVHPADAKYFP